MSAGVSFKNILEILVLSARGNEDGVRMHRAFPRYMIRVHADLGICSVFPPVILTPAASS